MKAWAHKNRGFTIVELLIVVVIIAILAALAIAGYNGMQQRARASAASSALSQASKKLKLHMVDNSTYPASLSDIGINDTDDVTYQYTPNNTTNPPAFCITATSVNVSYKLTESSAPVAGGCPGHGTGGVAAITNLATNPGIEVSTTSYTSNRITMARSTTWAGGGTSSLSAVATDAANADSYVSVGGDLGGFRTGLQAGKTYTISATLYMPAPQTGTLGGNAQRQIAAWYTSSTGAHTIVRSNQAPNAAGTTQLSVTFSIPSTAIGAWVRLYHGGLAGSGTLYFDNIMITEGSTAYTYADGSSPNWIWNGTAHNATSTGPAL